MERFIVPGARVLNLIVFLFFSAVSGGHAARLAAEPAQQEVTGRVLDAAGNPLPGATVQVLGTSRATSADTDGGFSLEAGPGDVLQVFMLGFLTQEVEVGDEVTLEIRLEEDVGGLDEVVVVGYGTQRREEVTSAIAKVNTEDFVVGSFTNPMQLIQGKVAGLAMTRSSGDPAAGVGMRIRGTSTLKNDASPLVVIDGVPGGNINTLRPEDIESIDVLKDGSAAAIYGTRGTAGVIIVTTKSGQGQEKPVLEYFGYATTENMGNFPRMLNAEELRSYYAEQEAAGFPNPNARSIRDYGDNTDWMREVTRTALTHSHTVQFKGGSGRTSYLAALGYRDAEGIALRNNVSTLNARVNLNHWGVDDRLNLTLNLQNNLMEGNRLWNEAFSQALYRNPTLPIYDEEGNILEVDGWNYWNPRGILEQRDELNQQNHFLGNFRATFEVTDGLRAGALLAYQSWRENNAFYDHTDMFTSRTSGQNGYVNRIFQWNTDLTAEYTLDYTREVGEHNFNVVGGYSYQQSDGDWMRGENMDFLNDDFLWYNIGAGDWLQEGLANLESERWRSKLIGIFARVNYNFSGRYLLMASVRREGSSKFGDNHKWGWFPAVSAGWRLSDEPFMSGSFFDELKLRAGFGITGTMPGDSYLSIARLGNGPRMYNNGNWIRGVQPVSNPNPDLRWETKEELNLGVDFLIAGQRLGGSIDLYSRVSKDLLWDYSVPVPPNMYDNIVTNVGSIRNRGIELALNYAIMQSGDVRWSADFNIAYNENTVRSLSNEYYSREWFTEGWLGDPGVNTYTHRVEEGQALGNFFGWEFGGFTDEGKWIFRDHDGQEGASEQDKTVIGNGIPKVNAGFMTRVSYRNWDLNVQFRGAFGFDILNARKMYFENVFMFPLNVYRSALDLPLNDDPKFSDYYLEKGDYVKLDNLTIGYNLQFNTGIVNAARFYLTGLNLLTITGYSGLDPEVEATGLTPGIEGRNDYPRTRQFTLGVNLTF